MKWKLKLTRQARQDLLGIHDYIAFQLLEPAVAAKQIRNIRKEIYGLKSSPNRRLVDFEPWRSRGFRRVNAGNYAVFFVADENDSTIKIARVVYARMDLERVLEEADLEAE